MKRIYLLALISIIPIALTSFVWLDVFRGVASRAIDGSGHYAIAQIYDQLIFPDVFGWTNAYFAGMPFPNFYPPLFFWCVALIHKTHLLSFGTAFKIVVAVPLLLMPAAFWMIARLHVGKDPGVALGSAVTSATLYTLGEAFQPSTGLDLSSTLLDGFYTQPLGFLLLLLWVLVYLLPRQKNWQFALASALLALTVLANFFNAITAVLVITSVLGRDILVWFRASDLATRRQLRRTFLLHLLSPCLAFGFTAFWLVPMLSSYQYLVTRPLVRPLSELITTPVLCWYVFAGLGVAIWLRRPAGTIGPYLVTCLVLLIGLIFSGTFAPTWFPLQVFRFFSTINFMLCIPAGIAIANLAKFYVESRRGSQTITKPHAFPGEFRKRMAVIAVSLIGFVALAITMSTKKLTQAFAFYTPETFPRIAGALEFARSNKDGRYLVEVLPSKASVGPIRADSLALNAYLGAQGNETVSIVYREASPNSSFFNAELNAFSSYRENFGISSTLIDDLDFINQPLAQHIKRLQFIGVHYLIIATQTMKERLSLEPEIAARHDIGDWTIFELRQAQLPQIRPLQYLPALVISDFTLKLRRRNQFDFMRLAEEQFTDGWFDVLLVRSPERKIDHLYNLDRFGALVIDRYEFEDEGRAFADLKEFAQTRPLILLSSNAHLFARIQSSLSEFPHALVIQRQTEAPGDWVDAMEPTYHYNSSNIRAVWEAIKSALDKEKFPVAAQVESQRGPSTISLTPVQSTSSNYVPVLLAQTYHPKWVRSDGQPVYAATPFFAFTFINQPTQMVFERDRDDRIAVWISLSSLLGLCLWATVALVKYLKRPS